MRQQCCSKITATALAPFGATDADAFTQLAKITGGTVNVGTAAVDFTVATTLNSKLVTSGNVTFTENTTLNAGAVLTTGTNTIATGATLTVGTGAEVISSATLLKFGPGTYTAGGTGGFKFAAGVITALDTDSTLALGTSGIVLKATGAAATATFTAAGQPVVLSGTGNGYITIPGGATAGSLTLGVTAELALGDGVVYLEYATAGGKLAGGDGSKFSGFNASWSTLESSDNSTALNNSTTTGYTGGVALTYVGTNTTAPTLGTGTLQTKDTESNLFAGLNGGGVITKATVIGST